MKTARSYARDFGTVLDVEDLIPGAEYTLEVSSPGLERKLFKSCGLCAVQGQSDQAADLYGDQQQSPLARPVDWVSTMAF